MIRNDGVDNKLSIRSKHYKSEHPEASHFLIHISDTHLIKGDEGLYGSTSHPTKYLEKLVDHLTETNLRPDGIIFTGDIADAGEGEAYQKVREIIDPFAAKLETEVFWVMGNHDNRAAFRRELLNEKESYEVIDSVHMINGLRLIILDSTVQGAHWGAVSRPQLRWLEKELSTPAPYGTIIAMHHPPVPSFLKSAISVELTHQERLANVLKGTDVRSIIAGHLHYSMTATFAGIPVSVASSTCYTQDLGIEENSLKAIDGAQTFNFVHIYPNTVAHSVIPLLNHKIIKSVTAAQVEQDLKESGFLEWL